MNTPHLLSGL